MSGRQPEAAPVQLRLQSRGPGFLGARIAVAQGFIHLHKTAWGAVNEFYLLLVPREAGWNRPAITLLSPGLIRILKHPREAESLDRVVGVAMRLGDCQVVGSAPEQKVRAALI